MFVSNDRYEGPVSPPPAPPASYGFAVAARSIGLELLGFERSARTPEDAGHARGTAHAYLEAAYDAGGARCA